MEMDCDFYWEIVECVATMYVSKHNTKIIFCWSLRPPSSIEYNKLIEDQVSDAHMLATLSDKWA